MLVIREDQLAAFRDEADRGFIERMRAWIAVEYPDRYATLGDEGTKDVVRAGLKTARSFGIDPGGPSGPTAGVVELVLEFGVRFERCPASAWAHDILRLTGVPDTVKVHAVRERFATITGGRSISAR